MIEVISGWNYDRILRQRQSEAEGAVKLLAPLRKKEKNELEFFTEIAAEKHREVIRSHPMLLGPATLDSLLEVEPDRLDYIKDGKFPFNDVFFEFMEPVDDEVPGFDLEGELCGIQINKNKMSFGKDLEGAYLVTAFYRTLSRDYACAEFIVNNNHPQDFLYGGTIRHPSNQRTEVINFTRLRSLSKGARTSITLETLISKIKKGMKLRERSKKLTKDVSPEIYKEFSKALIESSLKEWPRIFKQQVSRLRSLSKDLVFFSEDLIVEKGEEKFPYTFYFSDGEEINLGEKLREDFKRLNNLAINTINYINAQNVTLIPGTRIVKTRSPGGNGRSRRSIVHEAEKPYHIVGIDTKTIRIEEERDEDRELQWRVYVRGHNRKYRDQRGHVRFTTWVVPHVRGPEDAPWKHHRYAVLAGMLEREKEMVKEYLPHMSREIQQSPA